MPGPSVIVNTSSAAGSINDPNVGWCSTAGSDVTGTGTPSNPVRNVQKAYDLGFRSIRVGLGNFGSINNNAAASVLRIFGVGREQTFIGNIQTSVNLDIRGNGKHMITVNNVAGTGAPGAPESTGANGPVVTVAGFKISGQASSIGGAGGAGLPSPGFPDTGGNGGNGGQGGVLTVIDCDVANVMANGGDGGAGGQGAFDGEASFSGAGNGGNGGPGLQALLVNTFTDSITESGGAGGSGNTNPGGVNPGIDGSSGAPGTGDATFSQITSPPTDPLTVRGVSVAGVFYANTYP